LESSPDDSPQVVQLKSLARQFQQQLQAEKRSHNEEIDRLKKQHETELEGFKGQLATLEDRVRQLEGKPSINEKDYEWEPKEGDPVAVKVGDKYEKDWTIQKVGSDDKRTITAGKPAEEPVSESHDTFLNWQVESGSAKTKEPSGATEDNKPSQVERQSRVRRAGGWIGDRVMRRSIIKEDDRYYLRRPGRRRVVVDEVVAGELNRTNERAGILALGVVAVGAASILLWEYVVEPYLLHKHGIPPSGIGKNWQYVPPKGPVPDGQHLQFYNGNSGNHAFAVDSPTGYGMKGHPGDYDYKGPAGRMVEHLRWKANGPLSDDTRHRILSVFPELKTKLGKLFYSDHTGPGPHGWIRHYITSLRASG
jgi:hypothetical protein